MREIRDITAAFERMAPGHVGVLASLVHASGSTYRRIGARLLVLADDEPIGMISGGCLEGDLLTQAREVREGGAPRLVHYDSTASEGLVWGLGLGCAGAIDVLLEPVTLAQPGPLAWLASWRREGGTGVLATALDQERLAKRSALHPDGTIEGGPSPAVKHALFEARETGRSRRIATPEGDVTVEVAPPPLRLVVFGAGPDAAPVVLMAGELGWDVDVVDHRPAYARPERFPSARVHLVPAEEAVSKVCVDRGTYAVVMTHHYPTDRMLLAELLRSEAPYVGLLGPKRRGEALLTEVEHGGLRLSADSRARLHAPAGLDVGGDGPEAIALSLLSEVMAVAEKRSGGLLRDRDAPIHDPA